MGKNLLKMEQIILDLPIEIGRECLLRVPFIYHDKLQEVCKSWKAVVESPLFYQDRKRLKLNEEVIFVVRKTLNLEVNYTYEMCIYDPQRDAWKTMGGISTHSRILAIFVVNQRLISMHEERIMIYNFSSNNWLKIADVPKFRHGFTFCASPHGYIYVSGEDFDGIKTIVFDVEGQKWESLPLMKTSWSWIYCFKSVFVDGHLYVIDVWRNIAVFNTKTQAWNKIKLKETWCVGYLVVAFGDLYAFKRGGVMKYNSSKNVWRCIGSSPKYFVGVHWATAWNDKIFLSGYICNKKMYKDVYYLYQPPIDGEVTSERWILVRGPLNYEYCTDSATTLLI